MSLLERLELSPPPRRVPVPAPAPVSLAIARPGPFEPGGVQQLQAIAMYADGSTRDATARVRWTSSDEALVKVLPGGLAQAYGSGTATITASVNGGRPRDSITVQLQARLREIVVTPEHPLVRSGEIEGLRATAVHEDGSRADVTDRVAWHSSKAKVADFSSPGACVAHEPGTATVTATHADARVSGSTRLTVYAAGRGPALRKLTITPLNPDLTVGSQVQFKAMGRYADGSTHELTTRVKWESSDPKQLTIDAQGLARPGLVSGNPLVRGSDPDTGLAQSTTAYVDVPGVQDIRVEPRDLRIVAGSAVPVTVTATFHGGGSMQVNDRVRWTPADPDVADAILGGSQVQGRAEGSTTIDVADPLSGVFGVVHVTVLPPVLASIFVVPAGETIRLGAKLQFAATAFYSDGRSRDPGRLIWRSSRPDIVVIDPRGAAVARAAGTATITATHPGSGESGSVEVTAAP